MTRMCRLCLGIALVSLILCDCLSLFAGEAWNRIQSTGTLRWGADAEGGGPYVFPDEHDPTALRGFEVDLARLLADKLKVQAEFVQGPWDKLPDLLNLGQIDIVLNGYEYKPMLADRYGLTIPYYVYQLQVLVRSNDDRFDSLDALRPAADGRKPRVAVLGGSAAESYAREHLADRVELVLYEGNTDAMRAVELSIDGVDATIQDLPIVTFYEKRYPLLRRLGEPFAPGYYVILVDREDQELLAALNKAIITGLGDGSIAKIFDNYGLWNSMQQQRGLLTNDQGTFTPELLASQGAENSGDGNRAKETRWRAVMARVPLLIQAAGVTIVLSCSAMPLAILGGILIALGRLYGPTWLRPALGAYVEVIRGTPLALQLYVVFFLLPELANAWGYELSLSRIVAAILGLAVNYSAYEAEIYRAGLQAIPIGQMEAALSLGMTRRMALRRIVVPQAMRLVIPPVTNDFIALFKDTAVCSVITVVELSKMYYTQAQSIDAKLELGLITALLYFAMSYPLSLVVRRLERRLDQGPKP